MARLIFDRFSELFHVKARLIVTTWNTEESLLSWYQDGAIWDSVEHRFFNDRILAMIIV